ncbi:translation initiation factor IF-2 [Candidatus Gottesmanbacteria bacterium]|nr:translation initiation factor IF-2 [Candidatus Gottesmanbacteria bacterium]
MKKKEAIPSESRPPIVAVLGHVDHGKTTLLDTIRKTDVVSKEHGGITQHIGAYQIEEKKRLITFIDTPGHEAFSKMRSRGASVADIAILVVAADDSVKPQTIESIEQINNAGIPIIVAINKVDLPAANVDGVKGDLAKHGVQVEGFGGDVPFVPVSAKQGTGIPQLLDLILLVSDMKEITGDPKATTEAVVIETRVDKGKGLVATVVVKNGTLTAGSSLYDGATQVAKVRAMLDEHGTQVQLASPSKPVEVLGFTKLPAVGTTLRVAPQQAAQRTALKKEVGIPGQARDDKTTQEIQLPDFLKPVDPEVARIITIILKADTAGSLEAIIASLPKKVIVVQCGVGDITEADVLSAKSTGAIIIGFGVAPKGAVVKLAQTEKVVYRTYRIIYELLDELGEVVAGLKEVLHEERELGKGQIIAEFPFEKQRIAGTKVASGRLARGDTVKVMRGEEEIARAKIKSIRHGKDDITKADTGIECGVLFDQKLDFTIGDGIIAVTIG